MRTTLAVVAGIVILVGGVVIYRMQTGPRGGNAETTGTASATDGVDTGANAPPLTAEELALTELREEISRAEPVAFRSDEQRLAEARAWVEANRDPDWPYREIEVQILALMDVFTDSDKRSAEWVMNMSQIEVEMIRAIDADGDGQVSDDEVQRVIDENISSIFNPMEHPYLQEKFDTDGDGVVSSEEMAGLASMMSEGALAGAFERGKLEAWDADNDGFVSESERVAGEQAAREQVEEIFSSILDASGADLDLTEEQRAELDPAYVQQIDAARAQFEAAQEMMIDQAASQSLMEAMRLDNLASPDQTELMQSMPQPPDVTTFDIDGDGMMSDEETATQMLAMQEYQEEVQRWGAELTAYRLKDQFDHAIAQSDTNADGRLSDAEWEARFDDLLDERDERLFLQSYDLDGSGRVEAGELSTYINWYRQGSLRADINYDGSIDGRDLEQMARAFQGQGH